MYFSESIKVDFQKENDIYIIRILNYRYYIAFNKVSIINK